MAEYLSLIKQIPEVEEVWEERHFSVYRKGRALTVTIFDQGPDEFSNRYMASAKGANEGDDVESTGNGASTVEEALDAVHWWEFD